MSWRYSEVNRKEKLEDLSGRLNDSLRHEEAWFGGAHPSFHYLRQVFTPPFACRCGRLRKTRVHALVGASVEMACPLWDLKYKHEGELNCEVCPHSTRTLFRNKPFSSRLFPLVRFPRYKC